MKNKKSNVTNKEYQYETINGFKLDKTNNTVIITNAQRESAELNVFLLGKKGVDVTLDDMIALTLANSLGDRYQGKYTFGKSRSSSANTEKMNNVKTAIENVIKDQADIENFNGRPAFIDANGFPKYVDVTFVLKTPKGQDPTEYKNKCKEQVKNLLSEVKSETKNVINQ